MPFDRLVADIAVSVLAIALTVEAQTTTKVSIATGGAPGQGDVVGYKPAVSADGRVVAFASDAANLGRNSRGHHPRHDHSPGARGGNRSGREGHHAHGPLCRGRGLSHRHRR